MPILIAPYPSPTVERLVFMTVTSEAFLGYVALIALSMAILSRIEIAVPLFRRGKAASGRAPTNLTLTLGVFAMNWALPTATTAVVLFASGRGLLARLELPLLAQIAICVGVLDLCTYVAHWSMHHVPLLWRFHRLHHSDPFVDVTTTYRLHPLEALWRFAWVMVPAVAFGFPAEGIGVYRLASALNGLIEHANFSIGDALDRVLSIAFVTPNMHKVHHSRERGETNSNYGNIFAFYDRFLRTFTPTARARHVVYGLEGLDEQRVTSLSALLSWPFERPTSTTLTSTSPARPTRSDRGSS